MQPAELRKATAEIQSRNQLLKIGNAHLLNLLTESSVNTEQLASTLKNLNSDIAAELEK